MSAEVITRIEAPVGTRATRVYERHTEDSPPPSAESQIWKQLRAELARLEEVWGATDSGWTVTHEGGECIGRAYVGRTTSILAVVGNRDQRQALRLLLESLKRVDGT